MLTTSAMAWAQGPRHGRMDPSRLLQMEKSVIMDKIEGLTDQQKEELTALYDKLSLEVDKKMASDREEKRAEREAFKDQKNESLAAIFTEEQLKKYNEMVSERQKRHGARHMRKGQKP